MRHFPSYLAGASPTVNFGRIITSDCVNVAQPTDPRCSDPAFAIANPDLCGAASQASLIIKPAVALTCALGSIQFKAFTVVNGVEVDVTADSIFSSADLNVAVVGSTSGNATGMGSGETTISATYQGLTAHADFTVLSGDTCCQQQKVAMLIVIDNTKSMSQGFSPNYATKLEYARAAAKRFISEINDQKDVIGLAALHGTSYEIFAEISSDIAGVGAAADLILNTQDKTEFYDGMTAAIAQLAAVTADRKIIVLMSDGQDTLTDAFDQTNDPIVLLNDFKDQGGIVICLGVRASGQGFALLSAMATGGFFINAYADDESVSLDYLSGLKGYICAGDCTPTGDVVQGKGALEYDAFSNWNIDNGTVNLLGNGFFDYLPGHGMYVELATNNPGGPSYNSGRMVSKNLFPVENGKTYRISFKLAGNQRVDKISHVRCFLSYVSSITGNTVFLPLGPVVTLPDYQQGFETYAESATLAGLPPNTQVQITFQAYRQNAQGPDPSPAIGPLIDDIKFEDLTTLTTILDDNFDNENPVYLPPASGQGTNWVWLPNLNAYGYGYGYGYEAVTCLDNPPGTQQPDPNPLTDIESGTAPPPSQTTYTSIKTACAQCPAGGQQSIALYDPATSVLSASSTIGSGTVSILFGTGWEQGLIPPWGPVSGQIPAWVQIRFPSAKTVTQYGITSTPVPNGNYATAWEFQGSNDGINWTTVDTRSGIVPTGINVGTGLFVEDKYSMASPGDYLYYRIYVTHCSAGFGAIPTPPDTDFAWYHMAVYGYAPDAPPVPVCRTASATSTISQQDADNKAYASALAQAQAALNCQSLFTSTQQYTATCPLGTMGNPNSVTMSATETSYISQDDADAKALAAAQAAAIAALDCTASTNTQAITLLAAGWNQAYMAPANPSPTVKYVGDAGNITKATVSIFNLQTVVNGDSFIIFLQAPDGTCVLLYYDNAGPGGKAVSGPINLVFDDDAAGPVPFDASPLASGTFQPSNGGVQPGLTIPAPAPQPPFSLTLAALAGKAKAGAWSLWVGERLTQASSIANGWDITLT